MTDSLPVFPGSPLLPLTSGLRSWFSAPISDFLCAEPTSVLGELTKHSQTEILGTQRDAWLEEIQILRKSLNGIDGSVFLEFTIPRMGRRIDAVVLVSSVVFAIEFKVGEQTFRREAIDQVWDYALDLKNFHEASHPLTIVPILIATDASSDSSPIFEIATDQVFAPIAIPSDKLKSVITEVVALVRSTAATEGFAWSNSPYHPTPTIVEAARALYAQHSVESIARYDAGAKNLRETSARIEALIDEARQLGRKVICFVTGVPGAGKTLVGLNVATHRRDQGSPTHAVFLSGNGPLVAVLREALARDEMARLKAAGDKTKKGLIRKSVETFIQNVHHFRDAALVDDRPPIERVVIFDEAQRAWNLRQTANFMQRKKGKAGFNQSEPEFLISCMDRHPDWAVIVCLVGGGQEINTGEAGIESWLQAINERFPDWHLHISARLHDSEYATGEQLKSSLGRSNAHQDDSLHLSVSMRSFRAENVSAFVKALLDCEIETGRAAFASLKAKYPIVVTRDLRAAKDWIRSKARGSERIGMVASSKALRLKPHAIDIRVDVDPVHWFLNTKEDTRSSYYLEDVATEFQVQGLELDWVCMNWDGDLRFNQGRWSYHDFRGDRWTNIANTDNQNYLRNAYRVLLTRARQGMVIFIPQGDGSDPTRSPAYYDSTFRYLSDLGLPELR